MVLKFFTHFIRMNSPTYRKVLGEDSWAVRSRKDDLTDTGVAMTADVILTGIHNYQREKEEGEPVLNITIRNRMWKDPYADEDTEFPDLDFDLDLTLEEAIHVRAFIGAWIKEQENKQR